MDRPISRRPGPLAWITSSKLAWGLLAGALTASTAYFAIAPSTSNDEVSPSYRRHNLEMPRSAVRVSTVHEGRFEQYISVRGRVEAQRNLAVEVLEGGRVEEVFVKDGDRVKPGQPIARIYNPALAFEVLSLKTQMSAQLLALHDTQNRIVESQFQRSQALAKVQFERARWNRRFESRSRMQARGAVGSQEVQEAREQLDYHQTQQKAIQRHHEARQKVMKLQLQEMKNAAKSLSESYEIARERLDALSIKARHTGQISQMELEIGETVARGTRIASLLVKGPNKVVATVDEFFMHRVFVGQAARIDLQGNAIALEVSRVDPVVRGGQIRLELLFQGEEPQGLRRGQTVDIRLLEGEPAKADTALLVELGSFYKSRSDDAVFVVSEDESEAKAKKVVLGRKNNRVVEVVSGLAPGDRIVTSSYKDFETVQTIRLKP